MGIELKEIYKRYNQFAEYEDADVVQNQYTMIQVYNDPLLSLKGMEEKIAKLQTRRMQNVISEFQELKNSSDMVQPKSVFLRVIYLRIISGAIPQSFFSRIGVKGESIVEISLAIILYYLGLQRFAFGNRSITESQKKNTLGSMDFFFSMEDICLVRGKTTKDEFDRYMNLFSTDINQITENEDIGLYREDNKYFVLCVDEFLDYMLLRLEKTFLEDATKEERNCYSGAKGAGFETLVFEFMGAFFDDVLHTAFYVRDSKKMELDVIVRKDKELLVLECKSGTFSATNIEKDDIIKLKIKSKTEKAYKTLKAVSLYLQNCNYSFVCEDAKIEGFVNEPTCIHIAMYPMDFVASNIHTLFPKYLEDDNPILSMSLEHLLAMMLDAERNNRDFFDYCAKRKADIRRYPGFRFDCNELDLYYEIVNEENGSMLGLIKKAGILDQMNPNGRIVSSFHDMFGKEIRPAQKMIQSLDSALFEEIIRNGKSRYGINKRYLSSLRELLSEE